MGRTISEWVNLAHDAATRSGFHEGDEQRSLRDKVASWCMNLRSEVSELWEETMSTHVLVFGHKIRVHKHALCDTGVGIAGYFDVILPTNQSVRAIGCWDDGRRVGADGQPWCAEHVWVDGTWIDLVEEDSHFLPICGDSDGVSVEDIAKQIHATLGVGRKR